MERQEINSILDQIEEKLQEKLKNAFFGVMQGVNQNAENLVNYTISHYDVLHEAVREDVLSIKSYFDDSASHSKSSTPWPGIMVGKVRTPSMEEPIATKMNTQSPKKGSLFEQSKSLKQAGSIMDDFKNSQASSSSITKDSDVSDPLEPPAPVRAKPGRKPGQVYPKKDNSKPPPEPTSSQQTKPTAQRGRPGRPPGSVAKNKKQDGTVDDTKTTKQSSQQSVNTSLKSKKAVKEEAKSLDGFCEAQFDTDGFLKVSYNSIKTEPDTDRMYNDLASQLSSMDEGIEEDGPTSDYDKNADPLVGTSGRSAGSARNSPVPSKRAKLMTNNDSSKSNNDPKMFKCYKCEYTNERRKGIARHSLSLHHKILQKDHTKELVEKHSLSDAVEASNDDLPEKNSNPRSNQPEEETGVDKIMGLLNSTNDALMNQETSEN